MSPIHPESIKTVAIIGAGPSGLTAAKYLLSESHFTTIKIFEKRATVGGVWNYTPLPSSPKPLPPSLTPSSTPSPTSSLPSSDSSTPPRTPSGDDASHKTTAINTVTAHLPHLNTPMYQSLETNLPHMLMQFSDTPFPSQTQLFPSQEVVMRYLEGYADEIRHLIQFCTEVVDVRPAEESSTGAGWDVTLTKSVVESSVAGSIRTEHFDAVLVANGHCNWPLLPPIKGLEEWARMYPDSLHHSMSYKNPDAFTNKSHRSDQPLQRTLLVGGGPSGADISTQISKTCKPPLLVSTQSKSPYHLPLGDRAVDLPALVSLSPESRTAIFSNGQVEHDIDSIILCTGYSYQYPFLESWYPPAEVREKGVGILPLYKHIFHIRHPTLAFLEVPEMIVPFPLAEAQAAVVARVWSGRLTLPPYEEMGKWVEDVRTAKGEGRSMHALKPPQDVRYMKDMGYWCCKATMLGAEQDPPTLDPSTQGKMPREWDERMWWLRTQAAEMRKAFVRRGEERHEIRGYEELGFVFEGEGIHRQ
ncbi:MAG: hypothetical protein Q9183_001336 [Haloplaca sp. 2 TL-2023]